MWSSLLTRLLPEPKLPPLSFPPTWHLSIDTARQQINPVNTKPVTSVGGKYALVGEVYLRNRLELCRKIDIYNPHQHSDLQIVVDLWEQMGPAAVPMLEGMFAFVVWETASATAWAVRDPAGGRTLYYTGTSDCWHFSPRLRELRPFHSGIIDPVALRDYLCCAFVPGERTLWKDVLELRPGTILELPAFCFQKYWEAKELPILTESLDWHAARLRHKLEAVVAACLPDQSPVGVYLSGGLDSSCITALARKLHSDPVHTYSIHFGSETPNELEFSSAVAEHCQTRHHIIEITSDQMWHLLPQTLAMMDDPVGDPLTIPNLILGQTARQDVGVILNGEGGDPCFGGPKNQPMLLNQLYKPASGHKPEAQLAAYLASFQKCSTDLSTLLLPEVWKTASQSPSVFANDLFGSAHYLNRLLMINIKFKGADHILTKVNNITTALGLVGHSPLFDHRVVEMSLDIPPEFKLDGAEEKAVLKAAVADLIPKSILDRPKSGMMVPVQYWFREKWHIRARALLMSRKARIRNYLNPQVIQQWLDYQGDVWHRYGVKLWLLVTLEIWLQVNE
ncbi:MAG TPA: asparagine synthase-related protein [Acidobacteriota bacterium]|nr:asparagine synthase-related protein [Acidobacteriota bacterium]